MTTKEQDIDQMVEQFENREAGVQDLFEFYVSIEAVYAEAAKSLEEFYPETALSSTNQE